MSAPGGASERHWAVRLGGALLALTLAYGRAPGLELSLADRTVRRHRLGDGAAGVPVNQSTPDDRNLQQLWLRSKYSPVDPLTFDATINFENGGPTTERTKGGIYSYRSVFQSVSPSVTFEEAFVNLALDALEVRAGIQKFAWGRLDRIQAVDVLNVERFSDPFLLDEDERKIGVPAVQGSYYLPRSRWMPEEARLTLVWIPQYFPYWFPLPGERWYPPAATPPSSFPVAPLMRSVPVGFHVVNSPPPSFQLDNCGYAARASAFTAGVDYAGYYYHGFDNRPAFLLTAEARRRAAAAAPFVQNVTATTAPLARLPRDRPVGRRRGVLVGSLHVPRRGGVRERAAVQPRSAHPSSAIPRSSTRRSRRRCARSPQGSRRRRCNSRNRLPCAAPSTGASAPTTRGRTTSSSSRSIRPTS